MNIKMIETALGMLARFIPPEEYAKGVKAINELTQVAQSLDDRLKAIHQSVEEMKAISDRVDMLETVVRNNVSGAETEYAARAMFMVPGTIEKALAPSQGDKSDG